jgi:threonine-phosphate decarboxylase
MEIHEHGGDIFAYDNIRYDFSVNINPLGMPEAIRETLCRHMAEYETYPDTKYRALREAIADMEGIPPEQVICGNGAADLIYKLCLSQKPKNILVCAPTFSEYERAALLAGASVSYYTLEEDRGFIPQEGMLDHITPGTDMVFLCSPNNPTGRLIHIEFIEKVVKKAREAKSLLVLDECFLDFTSGSSAKHLMEEYKNLVILKAFTKIYAMAGLRLGYLICADREFLEKTDGFGQCWSVSSPAQYAGIAACSLDSFIEKTRRLVSTERAYLSEGLKNLGIRVFESDANFILLKCQLPLKKLLIEKGILIRSCDNFRGLDTRFYRVAVKTRQANEALLSALKEIMT